MTYVPSARPPNLRRDVPPPVQWQAVRPWSPPPVHLPLVTRDRMRAGMIGVFLLALVAAVLTGLWLFGVL